LVQLIEGVPSIANVEAYVDRVIGKARLRALLSTCQAIAAECYFTAEEPQDFIDSAEQSIFALASREDRRDVGSMQEVMRESHKRMLANEARDLATVELPSGLTAFDRKTLGYGRGCVTVIAARPGMGKTALAMHSAVTLAREVGPVHVASCEMPREQLGMRMACADAGANVQRGLKGRLRDDERINVLRAKDMLQRLPIFIDDTPAQTLIHLRSKSRATSAKCRKKLAAVVVDYLQLMTGDAKASNRDQEISGITRGLKRLAKELDCPVIALSQLNRECEQEKDKRPQLRHLRESGGIEQDADDVVFVYRDEYYDRVSKDKGKAELIVAKQRNGPTGTVHVAFYGRSASFDNLDHVLPEEEDE
jgi:replicative DNA helicase